MMVLIQLLTGLHIIVKSDTYSTFIVGLVLLWVGGGFEGGLGGFSEVIGWFQEGFGGGADGWSGVGRWLERCRVLAIRTLAEVVL